MADVTNLFVGPATLYVDGVNVGWTRGGLRMRVNKSMWARPSLDGLGAESLVKQSEAYYLSTVLVETTMANLRHAWGINEAAVGRRVDIGGSTTIPTHTLRFVVKDDFMEAYFYKVSAVDFGEIIYGSSKQDIFIPITFRLLLDTTKAVGAQIGYIIRGTTGTLDLVARFTVPKIKTNMLYSRTTVRKYGSDDLVSRTTVVYAAAVSNVVSRVSVLKQSTKDLVSRTIVTQGWLTSNMVSRLTVTSV